MTSETPQIITWEELAEVVEIMHRALLKAFPKATDAPDTLDEVVRRIKATRSADLAMEVR